MRWGVVFSTSQKMQNPTKNLTVQKGRTMQVACNQTHPTKQPISTEPRKIVTCDRNGMVEAAGIEAGSAGSDTTRQDDDACDTDVSQVPAYADSCDVPPNGAKRHDATSAGHHNAPSGQTKRVPCVHLTGADLPDDLSNVVRRWSDLPATVRQAIVLLVQGDD